MKKYRVCFPSNPKEQQKIANCLSSLDTLIKAETEKLDHLKDHKKGLLQQLFPAKGETKPQFRFQEFKNDGDWEERMLGKISKITTGRLDANAMVDNGKFRFYTCAKGFYYIDSHSGAGIYQLTDEFAQKTGEYKDGIAKLVNESNLPEALQPYVNLIKELNPTNFILYSGVDFLSFVI